MKRLSIVALGILLASGCSSSNSSPSTTSGPTTTRFTADLKPANESPAITNSESSGSGSVQIDLTQTKDAAGNVSTSTVNFTANMTSFPSSTVVNIAHIHTGAAGVNGGIVVNTTINPGEVVLTSGTGTFTRVGITLANDLAAQILANPAGFYFNIHTAANPGGVMRGQLVKQ
jgi:PBP1b-binding outer membrane lipoprotein LpoB